MERIGDIPLDERINSGMNELSDFHPEEPSTIDAHRFMTTNSPMRQMVRHGTGSRKQHQSTRREGQYVQPVELPDYVVSSRIYVEGREWAYKTQTQSVSGIRRVFTLRNQAIELDVEETLRWLSAGERSPAYEITKAQLTEEVNDINNQVILQLMYDNVLKKLPMLPRSAGKIARAIN